LTSQTCWRTTRAGSDPCCWRETRTIPGLSKFQSPCDYQREVTGAYEVHADDPGRRAEVALVLRGGDGRDHGRIQAADGRTEGQWLLPRGRAARAHHVGIERAHPKRP